MNPETIAAERHALNVQHVDFDPLGADMDDIKALIDQLGIGKAWKVEATRSQFDPNVTILSASWAVETCAHEHTDDQWLRLPDWFGEVHRISCTDCRSVLRFAYAEKVGGQEFLHRDSSGQLFG